jgi:scyllo-inositol 2-dehydrogenase (NADP+)
MRVAVVGLGVQGNKRILVAGDDVVATVDPAVATAQYRRVQDLALSEFDAAIVCTPDQSKLEILRYLLSNSKHVLVEKPLLAAKTQELIELEEIARSTGSVCYTAYNHRFEPHIVNLKNLLRQKVLGNLYQARIFYGNGTALDVKNSPWRDNGIGVLSDLGSHVLDMALFLFGYRETAFETWSANRLETNCYDHVVFGSEGRPVIEFEVTLLSWRNTFTVDVLGDQGSAHINGLCKWGPSTLTVRKRAFPSGKPEECVKEVVSPDPTWELEYEYFKQTCSDGVSNIKNDQWINSILDDLALTAIEKSHQ